MLIFYNEITSYYGVTELYLTRSVVCVLCSRRQNVCWSGIATLFDPELWHCLFHADIILLAPKVSFIQGNPMSIILLHMLPALLDLLMLETKKSRYIYTCQVNLKRKRNSVRFIFIPPCPLL